MDMNNLSLDAMRLKEEESDIDLQNIIDAAVSRQAAASSPLETGGLNSMPAAGALVFSEIDNNEPAANLFVVAENDAPDASDASDVVYTFDHEYATNSEDDADSEYAAYTDDAVDAENATDTEDITDAENTSNPEGRLIFLSRTLSGLVDMFLISLFSGIFLCIADYFTNAPVLSSISVVSFATLFLMIYLMYSIFFMVTNCQTIGMMATDLRVVGMDEDRVAPSQAVRRSAAFLLSLFGLGIGLLIGVFSRKCLCLHDRLSETCIIRNKFNQESVE
jgi:uncharacterized RDD family membrane protein YckC